MQSVYSTVPTDCWICFYIGILILISNSFVWDPISTLFPLCIYFKLLSLLEIAKQSKISKNPTALMKKAGKLRREIRIGRGMNVVGQRYWRIKENRKYSICRKAVGIGEDDRASHTEWKRKKKVPGEKD